VWDHLVGRPRYGERVSIAALDLDLDIFSGPFDLLLALILREQVDLLELDLAGVVLAYLAHIEARGELELETATEFIVLVASLLELKSRLMLPGEEVEELLEVGPREAAEELLEGMLRVRRYRAAAEHLRELLASQAGVRFRSAPVPRRLRRGAIEHAAGSANKALLGEALGGLLRMPPQLNLRHILQPRVSVPERLEHLRALLRKGSFSFEHAIAGADRITVAVTLYALLELYKRGEVDWEQPEAFGDITIHKRAREVRAHGWDAAEGGRTGRQRVGVAV
jgi:segregation and condensation protein A